MCPSSSNKIKEEGFTLVYETKQGEIEEYFKYLQGSIMNAPHSNNELFTYFLALFKNCQHNPSNVKYIKAKTIDYLQSFLNLNCSSKIYRCDSFRSLVLAFFYLLAEHSQSAATMLAERMPAILLSGGGEPIFEPYRMKMALLLADKAKNNNISATFFINKGMSNGPACEDNLMTYSIKLYCNFYNIVEQFKEKVKECYPICQMFGMSNALIKMCKPDIDAMARVPENFPLATEYFKNFYCSRNQFVNKLGSEVCDEYNANILLKKKVVAPVYSENCSYYVLNDKKINPKQP